MKRVLSILVVIVFMSLVLMPLAEAATCTNCGGTGDCPRCDGDGITGLWDECTVCGGTGNCQVCGGDGQVSVTESTGLPDFENNQLMCIGGIVLVVIIIIALIAGISSSRKKEPPVIIQQTPAQQTYVAPPPATYPPPVQPGQYICQNCGAGFTGNFCSNCGMKK